jgi:hypothetical protein
MLVSFQTSSHPVEELKIRLTNHMIESFVMYRAVAMALFAKISKYGRRGIHHMAFNSILFKYGLPNEVLHF